VVVPGQDPSGSHAASALPRASKWEQLFGVTKQRDGLARLREYMVDKSMNLRPAFAL